MICDYINGNTYVQHAICNYVFTKVLAAKFALKNYLLYGLRGAVHSTMLMCNYLLIFCMQVFVML